MKINKYNGIINLIANPIYLIKCYEEIKSKPGNMSPGTRSITLDGIDKEWFIRTSTLMKQGKFKFTPARRVMIPKPGKTGERPLSVANPREKIIQKALEVAMNNI